MGRKNNNKELLKNIKSGIRLKTKPPKVEDSKTTYNRKKRHFLDMSDEDIINMSNEEFDDYLLKSGLLNEEEV
jgi:hypothetical protein